MARNRKTIETYGTTKSNLVCIFCAEIDSQCCSGDRSCELYASAIMLMWITKITRRLRAAQSVRWIYFRALFCLSLLCTTLHDVSSRINSGTHKNMQAFQAARVHCIIMQSMSAKELTMRKRRARKKFMAVCIRLIACCLFI